MRILTFPAPNPKGRQYQVGSSSIFKIDLTYPLSRYVVFLLSCMFFTLPIENILEPDPTVRKELFLLDLILW